jgi:hypothetical protein
MSRGKTLAFFGAALALLALQAVDRRRMAAERAAERSAVAAQIAALEARLDAEERKPPVAHRATRSEVNAPPAAPSRTPPPVAAQPEEETPEQTHARLARYDYRSDEEMETGFEQRFANDPVDPAWGPPLERELLEAMKSALPETSTLVSLACHGVLCRMEVEHADPLDHNRFNERLFPMQEHGPIVDAIEAMHIMGLRPNGRGGVRVTAFIGKRDVPMLYSPGSEVSD